MYSYCNGRVILQHGTKETDDINRSSSSLRLLLCHYCDAPSADGLFIFVYNSFRSEFYVAFAANVPNHREKLALFSG